MLKYVDKNYLNYITKVGIKYNIIVYQDSITAPELILLLTGRETAKTQIFLLPQIFHHEYKIFMTRNPGYPDHFIMFSS
jgi:hypothetical protein